MPVVIGGYVDVAARSDLKTSFLYRVDLFEAGLSVLLVTARFLHVSVLSSAKWDSEASVRGSVLKSAVPHCS